VTVPVLRCVIDAAPSDADATGLLVLGPSLGTTTSVWRSAVAAFSATEPGRRFRVLRFDLPGHGSGPSTREPFSMSELADAVVQLVDDTGGGRFSYAGVSLGGAIGIELALRHPERLTGLALFCTGAKIGTTDSWAARAEQALSQGTASLVVGSAARWFAPGFLARDQAGSSASLHELTEVDDVSYALCADALGAFDRRADLGSIAVPAVAVSGEFDESTPPAQLEALAAGIPGAEYVSIRDAAHLVPLESPTRSAEIIADLIGGSDPKPVPDSYAAGMAVRREVLGSEHVDRQQANMTPETADFQDFITRFAWGTVWTRPGLDRRERSIATLASLITSGHRNEIGLHVRAALRNGLTRDEISEVILHTAIYAGVPASNDAFAIAREVFASITDEQNTHEQNTDEQSTDEQSTDEQSTDEQNTKDG
jgi:3-oxoadipate enol-lactonase/4-carboxymuconolactone decarboxylase